MAAPLTRAEAHAQGWSTLRELTTVTPKAPGVVNALGNTAAYLLIDGAAESEEQRRVLVGVLRSASAYEAGGRGNYEQLFSEAVEAARSHLAA